jgi:hypothetical protein
MHGGKSIGSPGHQNNLKHGLYARKLSAENLALMESAPVGTVDAELQLLRLRLAEVANDPSPEAGERFLTISRNVVRLGPVDIHRVARTVAARWMVAAKLVSVLS